MTKRNWFLIVMTALSLALSPFAFAGNRPGAVTISLQDSYYDFAAKRKLDDVNMPNAAIAYNFDNHWAAEAGVGLINTHTTSSNANPNQPVHGFLYTVDGIYRFCPVGIWEPYVIAGVGVLSLKPNGLDALQEGNMNAGLGTQIFFHHSVALRGEARDVYTMAGGKNDWMLNLGVSILLDNLTCSCCRG